MENRIYEMFSQGRAAGAERKKQRTLAGLMQPALGGDSNALAQVYQVDPTQGLQIEGIAQKRREMAADELGRTASLFAQTRDPQMYARMRQLAPGVGIGATLPESLDDPADLEGATQWANALAQEYGRAKQAEIPSDIRTLQMLRDNPELAELDIKRRQAGWQPKVITTADGMSVFTPQTQSANPLMEGGLPGASQAPNAYAPQQGGGDPFGFLADAGATVTSGQRSPADNKRVGGVPNSYHLTGQARDILPPQNPQQAAFIRQQAAANGLEVIDEGDHWHLEPAGRGGRRVMPAPKSDKPSALQEKINMARQMGASDDDIRRMVIGREGAAAGAKPLPVGAMKELLAIEDALGATAYVSEAIAKHARKMRSGELEITPTSAIGAKVRTTLGIANEKDVNLNEFKADMTRTVNEWLRLNKGVQTEGDAQREFKAVMDSNDSETAMRAAARLAAIMENTVQIQQRKREVINQNYGRGQQQPRQDAPQGNDLDDDALIGKYL